jgi:hypothetical protein
MPGEPSDWHMRQLDSSVYATQQQTAAAHIASSDEFFREQEPLAKDAGQRFQVLRCRHASEKDKIASVAGRLLQGAAIPLQWKPVSRLRDVDRNGRNLLKSFCVDNGLCGDKAPRGSDHEYSWNTRWRRRERLRVSKFPAEVQPADECECFSQGGRAIAQAHRQIEFCA